MAMADYESLRLRHAAEFQARMPEHIKRLSWPRDRIEETRLHGLRELLRHAKENSPWYARRLTDIDPDTATLEDLTNVAPMSKTDLMENFDAIVTDRRITRRVVEDHLSNLDSDAYLFDEYHAVASGGSSGSRGVFVYGWDDWTECALSLLRYRTRRQLADPAITRDSVRAFVTGGKASHMSYAIIRTFFGDGAVAVPAVLPMDQIVSRLNELQPVVLGGYSSRIAALAAEQVAGRLNISPRLVGTASEPLLPEMRSAIENAWNRPVINMYATSEGASASSCGYGAGLHLNEDVCVFEPIDASGRPIQGNTRAAKLYITPLFSYTQPLIRYELTDEVTLAGHSCECGSAMQLIEDIGGRSDDMFQYDRGISIHPMVFRSILGQERAIIEYQVTQTERGAVVAVRTGGTLTVRDLTERLVAALRQAGLDNAGI